MTVGSTHDALAWGLLEHYKMMEEGALPPRFYFVGDDAYSGHDQMLVPLP